MDGLCPLRGPTAFGEANNSIGNMHPQRKSEPVPAFVLFDVFGSNCERAHWHRTTGSVKKTSYKNWERKMKLVAGSNVRLIAEVEKTTEGRQWF